MRGVLEHVWGYRLQGNFVGERNGILQEAWIEYRKLESVRVRVGQLKEPFSLESSMSVRWIDFAERASIVTAVEPAQDIGAMLYGTVLDRRVEYRVEVSAGVEELTQRVDARFG